MRERRSDSNPIKTWAGNPDLWKQRLTPDGCPFCSTDIWSAHVDLAASWAIIPEQAVLPGYVLVVSKTHAIEPFDLPPKQRSQFWDDAMRTAKAVASLVKPVKMNYEIHGNTIPHLHMHIFPRQVGDPFERTPIDPHRVAPIQRSPEAIEAIRQAIADSN
jgi:diadenosine tetraphosphate (Ap4A) HIT family hydrolase